MGKHENPDDHRYTVTVVGVIALVFLVVSLVLGLAFTAEKDENWAPILTPIIGLVAPTIIALITLLRVNQTRADLNNGVVERPVERAIEKVFTKDDNLVDAKIRQALAETLLEHVEPGSIPQDSWDGETERRGSNG